MDKWQKLLGSTLAAVAIATAGCSGNSPFKNLLAKSDKPAPKKPVVVSSGRGVGHKGPPEQKGFSESVAGTWKSMTGKISEALTVKPKEEKPADPLRLDAKPKAKDPRVFVVAAELLERGGKFDQAEKQYEKALATDPKHPAALIGIARLHDREGKFSLAEKDYIRAIKAHPKQADYYNDLGLCLARQKKTKLAVGILEKAVELAPGKVLFRNNLATVLVDQGDYDEALKQFTAAQGEAIAHYNLGYLLSKRNQNEEAIRHLRIASQMKPQFAQAQKMLAQLDADRAAPNAGPTYHVTDRTEVASYTKPEMPAQLTSGVMLSRLPATDDGGSDVENANETGQQTTTNGELTSASPAAERPGANDTGKAASEEPAEADEQLQSDSTDQQVDSRDSAFIPTQPDQMTPPNPSE